MRECLSRDRRGAGARTLPTHLPAPDDVTLNCTPTSIPHAGDSERDQTVGGGGMGLDLMETMVQPLRQDSEEDEDDDAAECVPKGSGAVARCFAVDCD